MASGSTRQGSGSKGFDFASDDILCSYDDLNNQDSSANGGHSDSAVGVGSRKDFHKSRMVPASVFPSTAYGSQEESANEEIISVVERTMKKYADNLMRFLEGISSRLSQLELYCYNLDKSIGEMRSDLVRDHGEDDTKLKSLEKHLQEVHRSVQILRDKQELADTQKELAKLQLVQKECSNNHSQSSEDRTSSPISRPTKPETASDFHNQQLALTGPHHVPPQPSLPTRHAEQQQLTVGLAPPSQPQPYYLPPNQVGPSQTPQGHYLPPDAPQYQHQWPQQLPQMRPQPASVYPSYAPTPPSNPPPDTVPAQMPFSAVPQPSRSEATPYGYGGSVRTSKGSYGPHPGDGYAPAGSQQAISGGNAYMVYDGERGRAHHPPPSYAQGSYPPASVPPLNPTVRNPILRNPINSDLVEKLMGMGFRGDHVASVINRMEESGQPVDFNSVLDRLNGHSSGGSQRGW